MKDIEVGILQVVIVVGSLFAAKIISDKQKEKKDREDKRKMEKFEHEGDREQSKGFIPLRSRPSYLTLFPRKKKKYGPCSGIPGKICVEEPLELASLEDEEIEAGAGLRQAESRLRHEQVQDICNKHWDKNR